MSSQTIFDDVAPWPTAPVREGPAPKGDNKPPLDELIPLEFREELLADKADFLQLLDDYLGPIDPETGERGEGVVDRAQCKDEETFAKCGSVINRLRTYQGHVDDTHKKVKAPYLEGGRLVDGQKNALTARILAGKQVVEAKQQAYVRQRQKEAEEQRRKEAEECARIEAERQRLAELAAAEGISADAIPPAPEPEPEQATPEPIKVRAEDGASVSVTMEQVATVTDYAKAFRLVKDDARVREAIDAAISRLLKATKAKELAGCTITERPKINNR